VRPGCAKQRVGSPPASTAKNEATFGLNHTFAISDSGGVGRNFNAHQSVDAIKGRLSYLFPIH
jgi:hypothetical protein